MAFVDEIKLHLKAGDGGKGVVRFRREKFRPKGGPAGGNGGRGGDVYIRGVRDSELLKRYASEGEMHAESGEAGGSNSLYGKAGEDLVLDLPIGSMVTNTETGDFYELLEEDEKILILKGGNGGLGNEHFKSSTNQTPKEWTPGKPGQSGNFNIEIRLIADAGFVGFPNAGKSSLLNALTNAQSKVADYAFTTLSPHLGNLYGYILADIPGIIEGASDGKGLGHKFLRHISRTRLLVYTISLEEEDYLNAFNALKTELSSYDESMLEKPYIIVFTKEDLVDDEDVKKARELFSGEDVFVTSIIDDVSIKSLSDGLTKILSSTV